MIPFLYSDTVTPNHQAMVELVLPSTSFLCGHFACFCCHLTCVLDFALTNRDKRRKVVHCYSNNFFLYFLKLNMFTIQWASIIFHQYNITSELTIPHVNIAFILDFPQLHIILITCHSSL